MASKQPLSLFVDTKMTIVHPLDHFFPQLCWNVSATFEQYAILNGEFIMTFYKWSHLQWHLGQPDRIWRLRICNVGSLFEVSWIF